MVRDFNKEKPGYRAGQSMNTPVQGTAAEIILEALGKLAYPLHSQVHDEINLLVPVDQADEAKAHLEQIMVEAFMDTFPEHESLTNGLVDIATGDNWAEAH
jgi:DNA polymerase I-like protein with 3'-5' exonuclease and polymerase domains